VLQPPAAVVATRHAPLQTAKPSELRGGAVGRSNMLAPLSVASALPIAEK
jgi:hypothetical protein